MGLQPMELRLALWVDHVNARLANPRASSLLWRLGQPQESVSRQKEGLR